MPLFLLCNFVYAYAPYQGRFRGGTAGRLHPPELLWRPPELGLAHPPECISGEILHPLTEAQNKGEGGAGARAPSWHPKMVWRPPPLKSENALIRGHI